MSTENPIDITVADIKIGSKSAPHQDIIPKTPEKCFKKIEKE